MFLLSSSMSNQLFTAKTVAGPIPPSSTPTILVPSDIAANHAFGTKVDVSNDTLIASSPGYNSGAGAVYVFVKSGNSWVQQARLTPTTSSPTFDMFAEGAISIHNNTVVVAAKNSSTTAAVFVFVRSGTTWTQQAKITSFGGLAVPEITSLLVENDELFMGSNTTTLLYYFKRTGTTWAYGASTDISVGTDTTPLATTGLANDIARHNNILIVGSPGSDLFGVNHGAISTISGWPPTKNPYPQSSIVTDTPIQDGGFFGNSLSVDGSVLAVGTPGLTVSGVTRVGGVSMYTYDGGYLWNFDQVVVPPDTLFFGTMGSSVFVKNNRLIAGAPGALGGITGAVYVFDKIGSTWTFVLKISPTDLVSGSQFGSSVAIHNTQVIVGFPKSTYAAAAAGAIYLF